MQKKGTKRAAKLNRFKREPWQIANKLLLLNVLVIGLPTIICYYGLTLGNLSLRWLHFSLVLLYLTSAAMVMAESMAAVWRRFAGQALAAPGLRHRLKQGLGIRGATLPVEGQPLPRCSFIVAAYLPNEQAIILDTVDHLLNRVHQPAAGLEVILAYNTPETLPVEQTLARLARKFPNFRPHREVLFGDGDDGEVGDLDLVFLDEVEKQVQRPRIGFKLCVKLSGFL